ncbi:MAG: alcohol dehydrogenase [Candidatus Binatia bacterium]|nr:MAG: alcohol dehydrogenase [Candidatus Binatia bacterium]
MRAMVLHAPAPVETEPLRLEERPTPEPGPREVLVAVEACGVCRTDLHVVEGDLPPRRDSVVPGHQIVGRVAKRGPEARRFAEGARVGVAWLRWTCGRCRYCASGRENLCPESRYTGYHEDGGYAEFAVVQEDYAYALPETLGAEEITPLLCAGIIGYRALKRAEIRPGEAVGFYGFGASAHIAIQVARHLGCRVYVVTRDPGHRELARKLGAVWTGGLEEKPPVRFSSAVLFAPAGNLVPAALEALEPGGTLSIAGIYLTPVPPLDYERHLFHERNVRSVTANTREDGSELLRLAAEIPIRPETVVFRLEDANRALRQLKTDGLRGAGVLVP